MASYGYTFQNGDVVTPAKLNDARTISNIQTADIADSQITTAKIADSQITTPKIADGAVTSAKLGNDIILVPAGAIMPFAMNSAPTGWLAANGDAVSRATYAALFAAIGTTHGVGDGSTTFNLPDLRGYFIRGAGTNSDTTASASFGAKQADAFKSHNHGGATGTESANHTHSFSGTTGVDWPDHAHQVYRTISTFKSGDREIDGDSRSTDDWFAAESTSSGASTRHTHAFSGTTSGISNNHVHAITAEGSTETRPKNIALLYCIKF